MRRLAFALVLVAAPAAAQQWTPPPAKDGYAYPDCFCTNRGERIPMGGLSCLRVDGQSFLARCGMSLNNPTWRKVEDGCPTSDAAPDASSPLERLQDLQQG